MVIVIMRPRWRNRHSMKLRVLLVFGSREVPKAANAQDADLSTAPPMPVRLRFSLHGRRNNRIFHLVATDLRKRRDAKPIELLGVYDPRLGLGQEHKTMHWSVERILYWLEKGGAQPSKPVVKLLEKVCAHTSLLFSIY